MSGENPENNSSTLEGGTDPEKEAASSCNGKLSPAFYPKISRLPHSDSGIVVSPLTPASQPSPLDSPRPPSSNSNTANKAPVPKEETANNTQNQRSGVVNQASFSGEVFGPGVPTHLNSNSLEYFSNSCLYSPRQGQNKLKRSPRYSHHYKTSPDSFKYETKYVVLQFLQQTTGERNALGLSQSSLSNSESEKRWKGHSRAQRLRANWQDNRSASLPTSPRWSQTPLAKTKGNRSSPNLKEGDFFSDISPSPSREELQMKSPRKPGKSFSKGSGRSKVSSIKRESNFIRSVSNYTDNSENGTYLSDADDELDSSFDSSQHGSVVSQSLKTRMEHIRAERLPTVPSEGECLGERAGRVSESSEAQESLGFTVNDHSAGEALSLDMIRLEDQPHSPLNSFSRVSDYLAGIDVIPRPLAPHDQADDSAFTPDRTLQGDYDDVDSPPFNRTVLADPNPYETEEFQPSENREKIIEEKGTADFYQSSSSSSGNGNEQQQFETEDGACGGGEEDNDAAPEEDDVDSSKGYAVGGNGQRPDRSKLMLDLQVLDVGPDAVRTLQQEVEEEMSSFDSEFEEAMLSIRSDSSHSVGALARSHTHSPVTTEVAQILAAIGDDVQVRYFDKLHAAATRLLVNSTVGLLTYDNFRDAVLSLLNTECLSEWHQVAIVMLYSQHVALHLAQAGRRSVHRVVDFTVRFLADSAADFILQQGGWEAISALSHSSSSQDETVHSTGVDPLFIPQFPPPQDSQTQVNGQQSVVDGGSDYPRSAENGSAATSQSACEGGYSSSQSTLVGGDSDAQLSAIPTGSQSVAGRPNSPVDGATVNTQGTGGGAVTGIQSSAEEGGDETQAGDAQPGVPQATDGGDATDGQASNHGCAATSPATGDVESRVSSSGDAGLASPQTGAGDSEQAGSAGSEGTTDQSGSSNVVGVVTHSGVLAGVAVSGLFLALGAVVVLNLARG